MKFERKQSLIFLIGLLNRRMQIALDKQLSAQNVSTGQLSALFSLYEEDGLTQLELCQRNMVEQPTMANTLHRMERDDLVETQQDKKDRRCTRYYLTDRAKQIRRDLITGTTDLITSSLDGLPDNAIMELISSLNQVNGNLEQLIKNNGS